MWDDISQLLIDVLEEIVTRNTPAILSNAESNPDSVFIFSDDDFADALGAATTATADIERAVLVDMENRAPVPVSPTNFTDNSDEVLRFYVQKSLTESAARLHSSVVFRQVFEDDRPAAIDRAIEQTRNLLTATVEAEVSSSFAVKHQALAIENDFEYYRYNTSEDNVVRDDHNSRNQRVFIYGKERVVDDIPGLANRCRCFATPLTEEEALAGNFFYPDDRPNIQAQAMPNKFNLVVKSETAGAVAIDVTGNIDEWDGNDYDTFAFKVRSFLENDTDMLILSVTSGGGVAEYGFKAYELLKSLPNPVTANIYGFAGSAATYFTCGADIATIGTADAFYIHQAWTCIPCGNKAQVAEDSAAAIEVLEDADQRQIDIYVEKTGQSREAIEALMIEDRVITAQGALDLGFVDEIRADSTRSQAARGLNANAANINALTAHHLTTLEVTTMDFNQLMAALKADADLNAQVLAALVPNLADLQASAAQVNAQATEIATLRTTITERDSIIAAAQTGAGEVSEEQREEIRKQVRAELTAEATAFSALRTEVADAGLEAEGDDYTTVLTNAVQAAGGTTDNLDANSLKAVWASIYAMRKGSKEEGTDDVHAFAGNGNDSAAPAVLSGSRAGRVNSDA